jgi:hypothetical protein
MGELWHMDLVLELGLFARHVGRILLILGRCYWFCTKDQQQFCLPQFQLELTELPLVGSYLKWVIPQLWIIYLPL